MVDKKWRRPSRFCFWFSWPWCGGNVPSWSEEHWRQYGPRSVSWGEKCSSVDEAQRPQTQTCTTSWSLLCLWLPEEPQVAGKVTEMQFPLSTTQNFIYEVKLPNLSLLPFSQAYTDILIGCILCLRWLSWTAEQPNVTRSEDQTHSRTSAGELTPSSKLLQLQSSIDFDSFTAQS